MGVFTFFGQDIAPLSCPKPYFRHYHHFGKVKQRGYESLLTYYEKVVPYLNEPRSPHDQRE
jgi:hypothetical protein